MITKDYEVLCEQVVRHVLVLSKKRIEERGKFTLVLSGGTTPKGVYSLMTSSTYRNRFDWEKIHFFWGDERWVPPEDQKSHYRMAAESLLTRIDIPAENIHPIKIKGDDLEASVSQYEQEIAFFFKLERGELPRFDLILLGLGHDGHIASLFPGDSALFIMNRLVVPVSNIEIDEKRITMTLSVINRADNIFFLVSGREKAKVLQEVLEGNTNLPAHQVKLKEGMILWFADQFAASMLNNK